MGHKLQNVCTKLLTTCPYLDMERYDLNLVGFDLKDGAYYCYYAYVLRISRYLGFLWMVPTNTGKCLRGLKLYGEIRT